MIMVSNTPRSVIIKLEMQGKIPIRFDDAKRHAPSGIDPNRFAAQCLQLATNGDPAHFVRYKD